MKLKILFLSTIFALSMFCLVTSEVSAQYNGNPPPQKIHLDKQIGLPTKSGNNTTYQYVDNINVDSYHFSISEDILFRLIVKNVSLATLENVYIEDRFPWVLTPYADGHSLDTDTNTLTITVGTLYPSESKTYTVRARVKDYEWQSEYQVACHQNYSFANNGITLDDDTATFCVDKGVLSPTPTSLPTPTPILGCNSICETDTQCQVVNPAYFCYKSKGDVNGVCRLKSNFADIYCAPMVYQPHPIKTPPKKIPSTGPQFLLPLLLSTPVGIYFGKKLRDIK